MIRTDNGYAIGSFKDLYNILPKTLKTRVKLLWKVPQRPDYHPEGNTLKHVITVINRAIKTGDIDILVAALFHDLGKFETLQFKIKDRTPTAHGHEKVSATLVKQHRDFIKKIGANPVIVYYIVKQHMRVKSIDSMRKAKREFLKKNPNFKKLVKFSKIDKGGLHIESYILEMNQEHRKMPIPNEIKKIASAFSKQGKKLYIVGGAVRDFLLNKTPKDYDLATDAKPDQSVKIIKSLGFKTLEVGKKFGVVIAVTPSGDEYEIATFRKDLGKGRRPDGVEFSDITTDVKRRDLTINALFYDIKEDKVVDIVGGVEDLNKGRIKTVGDPRERFNEDPLRKLRALRFYGKLGKNIDPVTLDALKDTDLNGVSLERIKDEFSKALNSSKSIKKYLQLAHDLGYLTKILGGLEYELDFREEPTLEVQVALLLRNQDISRIRRTLNKLTYSRDEVRSIVAMIKGYQIFKSQNYSNIYELKRLYDLVDANKLLKFGKHLNMSKFINAVNSLDLKKIDMTDIRSKYRGADIGKAVKKSMEMQFKQLY